MPFPPDWSELLSLLVSRRARFLVVGAHALAAHGRPRFTGDLDLWVEPTPANARRVLAALREFGFGSVGLRLRDFQIPDQVVQLGNPPLRVDLLTSISGVEFRPAWGRRVETTLGGTSVAVLGIEDYLANKRAAGRPKDLADLALLAEGKPLRGGPAPRPAGNRRTPRRRRG